MPECKHCHTKLRQDDLRKSWTLAGGIKPNKFRIELYDCPNCNKVTRIAVPI